MPKQRRLRLFWTCLIALSPLPVGAQTAAVQDPAAWWTYDPGDAMAARIWAQAELLRAQGAVAVDFAAARKLHAEAVNMELDNWVKHVRSYWDRKLIREKKRLDLERLQQLRKNLHLDREKVQNSLAWNRLKNHPELVRVPQGNALNFLLHRLAGTALSYDFVRLDGGYDLNALELSPDQLHSLYLCQSGTGEGQLVFRADTSSGLELEWWPYLLRRDEFEQQRSKFERIRRQAIAEADADTTILSSTLEQLEKALGELTREFFAQFNRENLRGADFGRYSQFLAAESFLRRLDRELLRLQNTGNADVIRVRKGFDLKRDGHDLIGLLTYMTRNGLEFAPAPAGGEPAYYATFAMMRDLYITVADQDSSIVPEILPGTSP